MVSITTTYQRISTLFVFLINFIYVKVKKKHCVILVNSLFILSLLFLTEKIKTFCRL